MEEGRRKCLGLARVGGSGGMRIMSLFQLCEIARGPLRNACIETCIEKQRYLYDLILTRREGKYHPPSLSLDPKFQGAHKLQLSTEISAM